MWGFVQQQSVLDTSSEMDWPDTATGREMEALEETLLCPICQQFYDNQQARFQIIN